MSKSVIKLTESQLEELVKKIMSEDNSSSVKSKKINYKNLKEGKEFLKKFHKRKKALTKEGYTRKQINENLVDMLNYGKFDLGSSSYSDEEAPTTSSSIMGSAFADIGISSAKQLIIGWILKRLNLPENVSNLLAVPLSKVKLKDYPKLLDPVDNCDFIADVLYETILQIIVQRVLSSFGTSFMGRQGSQFGGGMQQGGMDIFTIIAGNAVSNMTKQVEFTQYIRKYLKKELCKALGGVSGESDLSNELESSEINPSLVDMLQKDL